MAVDWSHLPPELVDLIANKINFLDDYIRFRAVCTDWRASTPITPTHLPPQLPWLMLPATLPDGSQTRASFFCLSNNKRHSLTLPLPSATPSRRCGSSHGWLAIVDETPSFYLVNPLLKSQQQSSSVVALPPLTSFPNVINFDDTDVGREYLMNSADGGEAYTCNVKEMRDSFIKKVILSAPPLDESNYFVLAIVNLTGDLAYCKRGDVSWKFIDGAQGYCEDAVFIGGMFYAVNKFGGIVACDVSGDSTRVSFINTPLLVGGDRQYLVAWRGELLLVTRYLDLEFDGDSQQQLDIIYRTTEFQVFRLDWKGLKWEVVTTLDDWALFLGENSSFALLASDFPGCKGNQIYFTDDYSEWNYDGVNGDHDLGVYNLEDGSIEAFPCYPRNSYSGRSWPPPIWVTPNPC